LQIVDPWTNNFAYVGRRATGTGEGRFLISAPGSNGSVPDGVTHIPSPNSAFSIIGRYAVSGVDDIPNVARLQEQTWVTPLSRYPEPPETPGREYGDRTIAPFNQDVPESLGFWERFRSWMARFPPPQADRPFVQLLAPLGLLGGPDACLTVSPELVCLLAS
jgi:hypothetical protein